MGRYFDELSRAMEYLGEQKDTIFLGQAVEYKGTAMTNTLKKVPRGKLLEMPVSEEMQMGLLWLVLYQLVFIHVGIFFYWRRISLLTILTNILIILMVNLCQKL